MGLPFWVTVGVIRVTASVGGSLGLVFRISVWLLKTHLVLGFGLWLE